MSGTTVTYTFPTQARRAAPCRDDDGKCGQVAKTAPASRTARLLALAHAIERQVESGELKDYAEAARVLGTSRARVGQVMALLNLSPRIQEAILLGELSVSERVLRGLRSEAGWGRQERVFEGATSG